MKASDTPFWQQLYREQRPFFLFFALFFLAGTALLFFIDKGDTILYFNAHRTPFFDVFFSVITRFGEALMYVTALVLFLWRKRYIRALSVVVVALSVTVTSYGLKSLFAHDRPITFFKTTAVYDQLTFVDGVYINKAATSFPSGHTMSAFAICFFIALAFPHRKYISGSLFVLALLVGISRIYLVQHFFEDIYVGAAIGMLLAILIHGLTRRVARQLKAPSD
ncbi:MAG: phosphatase PAP2 family protein [Bacteroidota bacterium]